MLKLHNVYICASSKNIHWSDLIQRLSTESFEAVQQNKNKQDQLRFDPLDIGRRSNLGESFGEVMFVPDFSLVIPNILESYVSLSLYPCT